MIHQEFPEQFQLEATMTRCTDFEGDPYRWAAFKNPYSGKFVVCLAYENQSLIQVMFFAEELNTADIAMQYMNLSQTEKRDEVIRVELNNPVYPEWAAACLCP
jgi:hypothetical protein